MFQFIDVRQSNQSLTTADSPTFAGANLDGAVTINESGADVDFRVEGTGEANALFVDGANGNVGVGTNAPGSELSVSGNIYSTGTIGSTNGNVTHIASPDGGRYKHAGAGTGAIEITLPVLYGNQGIRFAIDVMNQANDETFTVFVGGLLYAGSPAWVYTSAQIIGSLEDRDFTVRFGNDGSNSVVWIGELTDTWSHVQITVRDVSIANAVYDFDTWKSGWSITIESSSFDTVDATESNNFPWSVWSKIKGQTTATPTFAGADLDGAVTINESGANVDFRVEGVGQANALFVDGANSNVGVGTTPDASAILQAQSTSKGFLPPVMTGVQVEAISSPAEGLMAYATNAGTGDVTGKGWWGWDGTNWVQLG